MRSYENYKESRAPEFEIINDGYMKNISVIDKVLAFFGYVRDPGQTQIQNPDRKMGRYDAGGGDVILFPADLIFTRSKMILGKAIRWFERGKGEDKSYTNHTAGIGMSNNVVEAQTHVISTPFDIWKNGMDFQLWRTVDLHESTQSLVAAYAENQVGRDYGYLKLIPHALDGLLSKLCGGSPYIFRRMLFIKDYPVCSWLWSYAYHQVGLDFGGVPNKMSPDDMLDFCLSHPEKWERII